VGMDHGILSEETDCQFGIGGVERVLRRARLARPTHGDAAPLRWPEMVSG
jgi:hypothetical protein